MRQGATLASSLCGSDIGFHSLQGAGMDLRGPILAMYQFPTLVIFCEGQGIATAKALLETQASEGGLNFPYREDVRMYYRVCCSSAASIFPMVAAVTIVTMMVIYALLRALLSCWRDPS